MISLKVYNYFDNMVKRIGQEFRLKNMDETKNFFVEAIKQNELVSNKHKNV